MERTRLNVKPAVGFTLPSAGLTPAPSGGNREMSRTTFRSEVLWGEGGVWNYLARYFTGEAAGRNGGQR